MDSLYSLIPKIVASIGLPCSTQMRVSVWTRDSAETLKQSTNYWPNNVSPGGAGRLRPPQGLVGRAFASGAAEIFIVSQDIDPEQHKQDLIDQLGFTPELAAHVNLKQRFRMAIPIMRGSEACGVFYCDSSDANLFAPEQFSDDWLSNAVQILSILEPLMENVYESNS